MTDTQHKNHDAYYVPGLHRGLRVLELIGEAERPLTISQVAALLKISRSSAFRLLYTLRHMGFLKTGQDEKAFELGPRILNLGFAYLNRQDIVRLARPHLERLRDETGVSSHLAIRDERDILYLDCILSRTAFVTNISIGTRSPAHATALGWLLLGSLDDAGITELYAGKAMPARTAHTPITPRALVDKVRAAAEAGYVVSRGFSQPGGSSVNAPVRDYTGSVVAAIDVSGPDIAFDFERLEQFYIPAVMETARAISSDIGHQASRPI
ncbi:IclR family transcriptional regulator [Agaricicola taiwanensis]|uniref:IclR family transcriptional regulator n=1 Tax=Agaricicola taiwanensis TaxID=591372 RepID=A0A8J2YK17_9RHOB|nr:IclR family transcriptional regulator [Agaricicola taiwanensis]GGE48440.1 IclR family transcriptional regulator [Agaricicola taiwanensis]